MITRALLIVGLLTVVGCGGPGHVEFSSGRCLVNGAAATLPQVEALQAAISERILGRQPLFVIITLLVVVLAGASHLEKVILLFRTRGAATHGLGERIRLALDRYRDRPVRYFALVVGTLGLLGVAGGFYVYLDADKRASERALGQLQFCHLALSNNAAEDILSEQRHNLEAIESTAGNIRMLVDKLPPAEQQNAKALVDHIGVALSHQGKLVSDYMQRTADSTKEAEQHNQVLERGLSSLESNVGSLKGLPQTLQALTDQVQRVDSKVSASQAELDAKIAALKAELDALAARPQPKCPAPEKPAESPKAAAVVDAAKKPAPETKPAEPKPVEPPAKP